MRGRHTAAMLGIACTTSLLMAQPRANAPTTDVALATHLLNRLGFGARPGDVDRVMAQGAQAFIDEQLHPEQMPDTAIASRLAPLVSLAMTSRQIAERYETPGLEARRAMKEAGGPAPAQPDAAGGTQGPERRLGAVPVLELSQQKVLRAVYSDRQLQEVLVDFWFNHFNVDARKGPTRFMLTEYERAAIRPLVLGRFRDLLGATARSPAMLFYLDNWMSATTADPTRDATRRNRGRGRAGASTARSGGISPPGAQPVPARTRGLNENYGRELLELHTLGVDGGYTQQDVTEVARAFTGWTIAGPRQGGGFRFVPALHDDGPKVVMGVDMAAGGGARDGERVLDLLAAHPATAHHISLKLAQRFVGDAPPPALVDRAAATFSRTVGDLRAVMRTLLTAPEFLAAERYATKIKTPFEFVVSALRATDADVTDARPVVRALQELGMPLYQCQPPTGYKDDAESWVNTGALVRRMNTALSLATGTMRGVTVRSVDPATLVSNLSATSRSMIAKATTPAQAMALALGSPEFQKQ